MLQAVQYFCYGWLQVQSHPLDLVKWLSRLFVVDETETHTQTCSSCQCEVRSGWTLNTAKRTVLISQSKTSHSGHVPIAGPYSPVSYHYIKEPVFFLAFLSFCALLWETGALCVHMKSTPSVVVMGFYCHVTFISCLFATLLYWVQFFVQFAAFVSINSHDLKVTFIMWKFLFHPVFIQLNFILYLYKLFMRQCPYDTFFAQLPALVRSLEIWNILFREISNHEILFPLVIFYGGSSFF